MYICGEGVFIHFMQLNLTLMDSIALRMGLYILCFALFYLHRLIQIGNI